MPVWAVALLLSVVLAGGLGGGLAAGMLITRPAAASCPESQEICRDFAVFWETWDLARDNYVEPHAVDHSAMIAGAINGMLDTLGDNGHTRFLTTEEARLWDSQLRGTFEGIGAYIDVRDGETIIVAPIEGSPAEAAGLRAGDIIQAVDGKPTRGWTVSDFQQAVRGPGGSQVTLMVLHPDASDALEITITRAEVVVPSVTWRMLPNDIALVRLASFDESAGRELIKALTMAQERGARSVILDLRNNPGGLLDQAVEVASQFLPGGTTVLLEESRDGTRESAVTREGGTALKLPLIVMVNQGSASSAEIVAGALQAAGRATLVGEPTFGTGTVLTPYRLSDGSRLLLGTQQWLTPDGRQIKGEGIAPDEQIALPVEVAPLSPAEAATLGASALRQSEDLQLVRAIELASSAASR
jgi:carboxyl-terminal processing protease